MEYGHGRIREAMDRSIERTLDLTAPTVMPDYLAC